jgi:hypothetical protein
MPCVKYRQIKAPLDYPGKIYQDGRVLEHHLVWWRRTGKVVPKGFVVHHRDGEGKHNQFRNLQLMRAGKHTTHHNQIGGRYIEVCCAFCHKMIRRRSCYVRAKWSEGQRRFFCSRSHAVKKQTRERSLRIRHGSVVAYSHYGCHCAICRKAHSVRINAYRKKRRAIRLAVGR